MNSDFRLSIGYFRHPKIQKLKRRCGSDGVLAHVQLLSFAAQNRPTGELTNMDAEDIGIACDHAGDIAPLLAVWLDLHLLDKSESGLLSIHDWSEHNPWAVTAPERSEAGRKGASVRWAKERESKAGNTTPEGNNGGATSGGGSKEPAANNAAGDANNAAGDANNAEPMRGAQNRNAADETNCGRSNTDLCEPHKNPCEPHKSALPVALTRNAPLPSSPLPSLPPVSERNDSEATTTPPTSPPDTLPPAEALPPAKPPEVVVALVNKLTELGVTEKIAVDLVRRRLPEQIERQVVWLPARIKDREGTAKRVRDPAATLVAAIEDGYAVPASYSQAKQREAEEKERARRTTQREEEAKQREEVEREVKEAGRAALQAAWDTLPEDKRQQVAGEATARFRQHFSFHVPALEKAGDPLKMAVGLRRNWEKLRDAVLLEGR